VQSDVSNVEFLNIFYNAGGARLPEELPEKILF
jgi:hypothetical protein